MLSLNVVGHFNMVILITVILGVATFVKDSTTPVKAEEGLAGNTASNDDTQIGCYGDHCGFTSEELNALDREGRTMITQHRIL